MQANSDLEESKSKVRDIEGELEDTSKKLTDKERDISLLKVSI